jgi:uncharacterized protein (UPF0332 family)
MDWGRYEAQGLVKAQRPDMGQVSRQVARAEMDLKTAGLVIKQDPEWASTIVYQAMLRLGRALMFSHGYLPADGRQHKTVVEVTGKLLGGGFDLLVKRFDRMRRRRNVFFYDSLVSDDEAQAITTLETAAKLVSAIKAKIRKGDPQEDLSI